MQRDIGAAEQGLRDLEARAVILDEQRMERGLEKTPGVERGL